MSLLAQGHNSVGEQPGGWSIKVSGLPHQIQASEKFLYSIQFKDNQLPLPGAMDGNKCPRMGPEAEAPPLEQRREAYEACTRHLRCSSNSPVVASFTEWENEALNSEHVSAWPRNGVAGRSITEFWLQRQCSPHPPSQARYSLCETPHRVSAYTSLSLRGQNQCACPAQTAHLVLHLNTERVSLHPGSASNNAPSTGHVPGMFQLICPHRLPFHVLIAKTERTASPLSLSPSQDYSRIT